MAKSRAQRAQESKVPRTRRKPVFALTPQEVIARCRENHHCLWVAGQVLALMALMNDRGWTIKELSEHSGVSRSHLSEILTLQATASTDVQDRLAETFGIKLFDFHLLTAFSLHAEVSG